MEKKPIGLAIVGSGTVGRIRGQFARQYPGVEWLGLCDIKTDIATKLAEDTSADFVTDDFRELIARPEVNAVIIATDENKHVDPILAAVDAGHDLFIEKPLATNAVESKRVLDAIEASGVDAVIGYTQRFRRRFQAVKGKIASGQIGDITAVVTRAFMNRMAPIATISKNPAHAAMTPMVISGTHSLDLCTWFMAGKTPVSVYAESSDKILGADHGIPDATFGVITMDDGTIWSMNISWGLPEVWPGAVYGIEIGIVGTDGVIDIDDTHRDLVLASERPIGHGYNPAGYVPDNQRFVDFMTSYPPGDVTDGELWGPMREETMGWFGRIHMGLDTPHATAAEAHRNLVLTMSMDLAAARRTRLDLPIDLREFPV
jgi:predicted dehydrogenase